MDYLKGNLDYLLSFINERLPKLKVVVPQATYLIWIDCKSLGMSSKEISKKILEQGDLRINDGQTYGEAGEGFIRINIACSRSLLREGLERLEKVLK